MAFISVKSGKILEIRSCTIIISLGCFALNLYNFRYIIITTFIHSFTNYSLKLHSVKKCKHKNLRLKTFVSDFNCLKSVEQPRNNTFF